MVGPITKSLVFSLSLLPVGLFFGMLFRGLEDRLGILPLIPYPASLSGLILVGIGFWLRSWAGTVFYRQNPSMVSLKTPPHLVTSGPWRYSRNPLYVGLILIGLGFSLLFASISDLSFTTLGFVLLHLEVVMHEEKVLGQKFGTDYLNYRRQVRRWI